ncbi:kinase-like domain-containing protein [Gigaspora rosea]|uniref:Kinase-like domain-containing protein n=1 Tax=Gigaspora rosea TaxID=44941 RepID=A0A397VZK6_9GLOM|nr:kinase-like domain-containing protein [Gigaspora rosea]
MDIKIKERYDFMNPLLNKTALCIPHKEFKDQDGLIKFFKSIVDKKLIKQSDQSQKTFLKTWIDNWVEENNISKKIGETRVCETCQALTFAKKFCESCIQGYLAKNFPNWSSGIDEIDDLIRKCQKKTMRPDYIVEWIPYENFLDPTLKARGGCASIYSAIWFGGRYDSWNADKKQLERTGDRKVILKHLENSSNPNKKWFREVKQHLDFMMKTNPVVKCYGLTREPTTQDFMLVLEPMTINLGDFLLKNASSLNWQQRIEIFYDITYSLMKIHDSKLIHRDLHPGNILQGRNSNIWYISDLGFCGPVNQEPGDIYVNIPYAAPEVLCGKGHTQASDIYSMGIIMWQLTTSHPPYGGIYREGQLKPFINKICEGLRPDSINGIPPDYENIMKICWSKNVSERPNAEYLFAYFEDKLKKIYRNELLLPELILPELININYSSEIYVARSHNIKRLLDQNEDNIYEENLDNVYINNSMKFAQDEETELILIESDNED